MDSYLKEELTDFVSKLLKSPMPTGRVLLVTLQCVRRYPHVKLTTQATLKNKLKELNKG